MPWSFPYRMIQTEEIRVGLLGYGSSDAALSLGSRIQAPEGEGEEGGKGDP